MSAKRSSRPPSRQACRASRPAGRTSRCASRCSPASANSDSKTHRMVNTVGPASTPAPSTITRRILPPGSAARSHTVTDIPARARSTAAARPPIPAPTTTTWPRFMRAQTKEFAAQSHVGREHSVAHARRRGGMFPRYAAFAVSRRRRSRAAICSGCSSCARCPRPGSEIISARGKSERTR